jgi:hypothetical protein
VASDLLLGIRACYDPKKVDSAMNEIRNVVVQQTTQSYHKFKRIPAHWMKIIADRFRIINRNEHLQIELSISMLKNVLK